METETTVETGPYRVTRTGNTTLWDVRGGDGCHPWIFTDRAKAAVFASSMNTAYAAGRADGLAEANAMLAAGAD